MRNPPPPAPALPLAALLADQRERWHRGECPLVEAYLHQYPALRASADGLLDLIYNEVFLREQRGDQPRRDEYLRRFPDLAPQIRVQFDVHQAIQAGANAEGGLPAIPGYELLAEVGRGGMGRVYRARAEQGGTSVAVKVLRPDHFRRRGARKRFVAEAQAAALDHPHIVKVFAAGDSPDGPYFVMELIEGPSLEEVLRRGRPAIDQAVRWLIPVAEAVHYAHGRGIIHRDLKPANIMIDGAGRPRVMDFGMAKILRKADIPGLSSTQQGAILGTPSYMPPEQAGETATEPGPYSDVYSLGAILYALLTGRPPFAEETTLLTLLKVRSAEPPAVRSLQPDVPVPLERICRKCLKKRPADRYPNALDLAGALRRFARSWAPSGPAAAVSLVSMTTGESIPLVEKTIVVGRSDECDLVLKAPEVSRRHCRIVCTRDRVIVEDLGSAHGIRVNGSPVARARLHNGDRLEIATQVFRVQLPSRQPHPQGPP